MSNQENLQPVLSHLQPVVLPDTKQQLGHEHVLWQKKPQTNKQHFGRPHWQLSLLRFSLQPRFLLEAPTGTACRAVIHTAAHRAESKGQQKKHSSSWKHLKSSTGWLKSYKTLPARKNKTYSNSRSVQRLIRVAAASSRGCSMLTDKPDSRRSWSRLRWQTWL